MYFLFKFKSLTRIHKQLRALTQKDPSRQYLRGSEVLYYHYQYVFDEGKFKGPINRKDIKQLSYVEKNPECTSLSQDLYELEYAKLFKEKNIGISKIRSFEIDFRAILEKIVACFNMPLFVMPRHIAQHGQNIHQQLFFHINDIFEQHTGQMFLISKKKSTKGELPKGQQILSFCTAQDSPIPPQKRKPATERLTKDEAAKRKILKQSLDQSMTRAIDKMFKYVKN